MATSKVEAEKPAPKTRAGRAGSELMLVDGGEDDKRRRDVDQWGRSARTRALARRVFDPLYRRWFRAEWEGLEHIPTAGGALLVSNHAGGIPMDAPVIMHGIEQERDRPVYVLAEHMLRSLPVVSTVFSRIGGVNAHPDNAYRLLHDEGELALVFPEGTKATGKPMWERYQLRRFGRGGFVELAMRAGVPVVPIAVVGSEEAMPVMTSLPSVARRLGVPYVPVTPQMLVLGPLGILAFLPAKFRLRVLPPIHFDAAPNQDRYSRGLVMEESEAIRQRLQEALRQMLSRRQSVWRG